MEADSLQSSQANSNIQCSIRLLPCLPIKNWSITETERLIQAIKYSSITLVYVILEGDSACCIHGYCPVQQHDGDRLSEVHAGSFCGIDLTHDSGTVPARRILKQALSKAEWILDTDTTRAECSRGLFKQTLAWRVMQVDQMLVRKHEFYSTQGIPRSRHLADQIGK